MENKRSLSSVDHSAFTSLASKRHKPAKDKKDQVGERIVALQQLVSPYGKTDTASVLLETMEYIRFLHDQVKVLSAPYLQIRPNNWQVLSAPYLQIRPNNWQDLDHHNLKNRGLCLVPISCTFKVGASSNGADIWAPMKTTSPKFN